MTTVPAEWQATYDFLKGSLEGYGVGRSLADLATSGLSLGAEYSYANSNRLSDLLAHDRVLDSCRAECEWLNGIGIRHVVLTIHDDVLRSTETDRYLEFFVEAKALAETVGLEVVVETQCGFFSDYSGVTLEEHTANRQDCIELLLRNLSPTLLSVADEPTTEATLTGLASLRDTTTYIKFLNDLLRVTKGGSTRVAAGCGNWNSVALASAVADTSIDEFNLHVYAPTKGFLNRIDQIAVAVKAHNKCILVGESGLFKVRRGEIFSPVANDVLRRDVWDFWAPLDNLFIDKLVGAGLVHGFSGISYFWTDHLLALLSYEKAKYYKYETARNRVGYAAREALEAGEMSPIGHHYSDVMRSVG